MNKYKTYIVHVYVCHINTTSSKRVRCNSEENPTSIRVICIFPYSITVSNLLYMQFVYYSIQFSKKKKKKWILPKTLIQHCFVTYTFLKRLRQVMIFSFSRMRQIPHLMKNASFFSNALFKDKRFPELKLLHRNL